MINEDTNYDTMRLIADAVADESLSVDDILQEFSVDAPVVSADTQKKSAPAEEESPTEPTPEPSPVPAETESDIADAIANAIAASFGPEQQPLPAAEEPESPVETPQQQKKDPAPKKAQKKPAEKSNAAPKAQPQKTSKAQKPASEPKQVSNTKKPTPQESVPNPGTNQKKIPTSNVRVSIFDSLSLSFSDLRERQRYDLPENNASLKAAEKRNSLIVKLSGIFTPVRYVILVLMILALAGRKYEWMQLGFLGGSTGVYSAVFATLVAMLASWYSVLRGCKDFVYFRFSFESVLLVVTAVSVLDAIANKPQTTLLPIVAAGWCLCGIGSLMTVRANLRSLRTVITGKTRKAVRIAPNKWEKNPCIGKASASTAGFVRMQEESDTWHSGWTLFGLLLVFACVAISAYLTAVNHSNFISTLATLMTVALPVGGILCCARPYSRLTQSLGSSGAVAGWNGMRSMAGKKAVLIYDEDLFPKGTVTHKGLKAYGSHTSQVLVSYAASLILRADNGLTEVFTRLLRETNGTLYDVSYFSAMESGASGMIQGVPVAVGTYQYMNLMGAMPPANAPKSGLFIAINRQIAGVFAIKYTVQGSSAGGLRRLIREHSLTKLVVTKSFVINPSFIERRFQVPASGIQCPKFETRSRLSQPSQMSRGTTCGFLMHDGIAAYGRMIAGGRRGYRSAKFFTLLSIAYSVYMLIRIMMELSAGTMITSGFDLLLYQALLFILVELGSRFSVK